VAQLRAVDGRRHVESSEVKLALQALRARLQLSASDMTSLREQVLVWRPCVGALLLCCSFRVDGLVCALLLCCSFASLEL